VPPPLLLTVFMKVAKRVLNPFSSTNLPQFSGHPKQTDRQRVRKMEERAERERAAERERERESREREREREKEREGGYGTG